MSIADDIKSGLKDLEADSSLSRTFSWRGSSFAFTPAAISEVLEPGVGNYDIDVTSALHVRYSLFVPVVDLTVDEGTLTVDSTIGTADGTEILIPAQGDLITIDSIPYRVGPVVLDASKAYLRIEYGEVNS